MAEAAPVQFKTIAVPRRYQQVADQIAGLIDQGVWAVGDRLPPERDLAQRLGVSRPTVREAMVALDLAGRIDVRTGAGTFVKARPAVPPIALSAQSTDAGSSPFEILDARELIEGETAARCAAAASPVDIEGLSESIVIMRRDIDRGVQGLEQENDGDRLFHVRLARATGNQVLVDLVDQLWSTMRQPLFRAFSERTRLGYFARGAADEHAVIVDRIVARDAAGARRAMHAHIRSVRGVLLSADAGAAGP